MPDRLLTQVVVQASMEDCASHGYTVFSHYYRDSRLNYGCLKCWWEEQEDAKKECGCQEKLEGHSLRSGPA